MKHILFILVLLFFVLFLSSSTMAQKRFQIFLSKDSTITTWTNTVIMDTKTGSEYYTYKLKVDTFQAKYPEIDSLFKITKKQSRRMFELDSLYAMKMREADSLAITLADTCGVKLEQLGVIAVQEAINHNRYKRKFRNWRRNTFWIGGISLAMGLLIGTTL